MKSKNHIEHEVDKTLNSLDGVKRAEANPYLFTRIKADLEHEEKSIWNIAIGFISKPAIALVAILLVILINASIIFRSGSSTVQSGQETEQVFASEYNLSDTTIYDSTIDPE